MLTDTGLLERRSRVDRARQLAGRRPFLMVAMVAAGVRIVASLVSFVLNPRVLIPDELQYIQLAGLVSRGLDAELWAPQYGQSLYDTTWTYTATLARLYDVTGETRLTAQLLAAAFGVGVAVGVAWLVREAIGARWALLAGLVVAVFPSQVLWSSVALRESAVWCGLVLASIGMTLVGRRRGRMIAVGWLLVIVALFALGHLRQQVVVPAAWSVMVAAPLMPTRGRLLRTLPALAIGLMLPALTGHGVGGWDVVVKAIPSLERTRTVLGDEADSAFVTTTTFVTATTLDPRGPEDRGLYYPTYDDRPAPPSTGGGRPDRNIPPPSTTVPPEATTETTRPPEGTEVITADGEVAIVIRGSENVYLVQETFGASASHFPRGFVGVMLRPLPWEGGGNIAVQLARVENVVWYPLYLLAVIGVVLAFRRHATIALFPFLSVGGVLGTAFLTEGNVGTAFRHRGQALWAIVLFATIAVAHLADRRRGAAPSTASPVDVAPESLVRVGS